MKAIVKVNTSTEAGQSSYRQDNTSTIETEPENRNIVAEYSVGMKAALQH